MLSLGDFPLNIADSKTQRFIAVTNPGWNVLNIYEGYEWKQLRFNTGEQNLFHEDYRTHGSGINGAERSVWVSVSVDI